jgi:hypothetical protein
MRKREGDKVAKGREGLFVLTLTDTLDPKKVDSSEIGTTGKTWLSPRVRIV